MVNTYQKFMALTSINQCFPWIWWNKMRNQKEENSLETPKREKKFLSRWKSTIKKTPLKIAHIDDMTKHNDTYHINGLKQNLLIINKERSLNVRFKSTWIA